MSIVDVVAQRILFPMYERHWGVHSGSILTRLQRSQFDSPDQIADRQWQAFREVVRHAADNCPFYRERFRDTGFDPEALERPDEISLVPILRKDDIRDHSDALIAEDSSKETMFHKRTGGSTGVPVHVYWDRYAHRFKRAIVKRHDSWAGYRFGMKLAALWGDTDKKYSFKERLFKVLCERTIFLDTLRMDEAYMDAFVEQLRRHRPAVLIGHAHSLYFFSEYLTQRGYDDIAFQSIISTAETLSPAERSAIEARFGRILFDRYGCEEMSLVASECEAHSGLHVAAEGVYVEVLDADETRPGRIILTDLSNRGMPLIRYEVGDMATTASGPCDCGRGLPRLGRILGRVSDILYAPDGRGISGISILDTFMIHIPGVKQAQIVQDRLDHVKLRIVPDNNFDPESRLKIASTVGRVFGDSMRHDLEIVDKIAPTSRGKYQFTICNVDPSDLPPSPR